MKKMYNGMAVSDVLDLSTYLLAKQGKLPIKSDFDMFSYLLGKSQASPTKTSTGVDIPTVNGSNTLTVGTTVQPSSMTITYHK